MVAAPDSGSFAQLADRLGRWSAEQADLRRPRGSGRRLERELTRRVDGIYARLGAVAAPPGTSEASALEWLLDNHYVVRGGLNQLRQDLPRGHFAHLPAVRDAAGDPVPRLLHITTLLLEACGLPLDVDRLVAALDQVQQRMPLGLSELWALPALLRAELLGRLVDAAHGMLQPGALGDGATAESGRASVPGSVISSCIISLRQLAVLRWVDVVERTSRVEAVLREDPAAVYAVMDPASRDRYRRAVEEIAWCSGTEESRVARAVVELSASQPPDSATRRHVGFHLIDDGREPFEQQLEARPAGVERLRRWLQRHATGFYLGLLLIPAGLLLVTAALLLAAQGLALAWIVPLVLVAGVPAISVATIVGNWLVTQLFAPQLLPGLDFEAGIATNCATVVVVPAFLGSAVEARRLARNLEVSYLRNPDSALRFALLTDYPDAGVSHDDSDDECLSAAVAAIDDLNERYGGGTRRPFGLFHRRRCWNDSERRWMGWERKRGKLLEFNRLLLGDRDTSFDVIHGDLEAFLGARFVITLDADTRMPAGTAARLTGILAHPLNRPEFDPLTGRVQRGYTVLQPRVEIDPSSFGGTLFSRLFAGAPALDPYVRAVSDVYQDLFGMGIFAGKGIYDLVAFHAAVNGHIPENIVLSHDLLEGLHGRAAFVSDVTLLEDFPPTLAGMLRRTHRWVRGDWQLLRWLVACLDPVRSGPQPVPFSLIDRWKLADNLRRSLQPVAWLVLLVLVWLVVPAPLPWTLVLVLLPSVPTAVRLLSGLRTAAWRWGTWGSSARAVGAEVGGDFLRWLANLTFAASECWVVADAITRSLYRQWFSRRRLLEWEPAAQSAVRLGGATTVWRSYLVMWPSWLSGVVAVATVARLRPDALAAAAPIAALWCVAPWLAVRLARPTLPLAPRSLTRTETAELRVLARRTWRFFQQFMGPASHWLPPDNVQTAPGFQVAPRTSPTNIGLALLAMLCAHDLGYLTRAELLVRVGSLIQTLTRLERHRGHLYNWYDTRNLRPLEPRYVSTVDSGNLVAALIAARQGLLGLRGRADDGRRLRQGLADTLAVVAEVLADAPAGAARIEAFDLASAAHDARKGLLESPEGFRACRELVSDRLQPALLRWIGSDHAPTGLPWMEELRGWVQLLGIEVDVTHRQAGDADGIDRQIDALCDEMNAIASDTDFRFLYDERRHLFHIGYNTSSGEVDRNHYDLLASEARLASFVAIAKGDAPPSHWMYLGRPLRRVRGHRVLLSWSATAFEYFMPRLLMRTPSSGLLYQSCLAAIAEQRREARRLGLPWGMSESAYYEMDIQGEYQYRAFGLPGLALRREQSDRVVIAPYASVLSLPFDVDAVMGNLRRLGGLGMVSSYGLAEAADFGHPSSDFFREPRIVHAYMAHHQGMVLVAISNAVLGDVMLERFHADVRIASAEYLLYEHLPERAHARGLQPRLVSRPRRIEVDSDLQEWRVDPARPAVNVLSNGHLRTLTTSQGGSVTYWNDTMLNRWRPELDGEYGGAVLYCHDLDTGEIWSLGWDELGADALEVRFAAHQSDFRLRRHDLVSHLAIAISPDADVEVRHLTLGNQLDRPRRLRVAFAMEPVMAPEAEDRRHAAFNKLFIECAAATGPADLLLRRRPRAVDEQPLFVGFGVVTEAAGNPSLECYSDRATFLGRRGDPRRPAALAARAPVATEAPAPTLDPIAAFVLTLTVPPRGSASCALLTAVGRDRARVLNLLDRNRSMSRIGWIASLARNAAQQELTLVGLEPHQARLAMLLAERLVWPRVSPGQKAARESSRAAQNSLWARGVSGDLPVVVLRVRGVGDLASAELLLGIHALLRRRGFDFDLIFLDEASSGYSQPTRDRLASLIDRARSIPSHRRRGTTSIVPAGDLNPQDRANLIAAAGVLVDPELGVLEQAVGESAAPRVLPPFVPLPSQPLERRPVQPMPRAGDLVFDNSYGGFTPDGREYQIHVEPGRHPPAPWVNVMANPAFGAIVTDGGLGCTWAGNSSENRLTPWHNDPVTDRCGETCLLRDEESGVVWSPTPLPLPGPSAYRVSHGSGYTRFEHASEGLEQVVTVFVDPALPLKFVRLSVRNLWRRTRRLTVTLAVDWVLGNDRSQTCRWIVTGTGAEGRVLTARNAFDRVHPEQTAFLTATLPPHAILMGRGAFLGRARNSRDVPEALRTEWPADDSQDRLDPGAAYQAHLMLEPDGVAEVTFVLGLGNTREQALEYARLHMDGPAVTRRLEALCEQWERLLGGLQINTPVPAWNLLANRWLLYQSISCRLWGRSGYYQPGGAYGFRDQLQDALALLRVAPDMVRDQLLRAAAVQFPEGDVLHWWHDSPLRGVRSRCADDLLWLPFATAAYVVATGDAAALELRASYLEGQPLADTHLERYAEFPSSTHDDTLYEHCCRAIEARMTTGAHGLPLVGTGDWNDGLNRVGAGGTGESVWMAWFMVRVCHDFAPLCVVRGEPERAERYLDFARRLMEAANARAWDGRWFLRGYYDDGSPLGGKASDECQIDLNSQAWAVLADAAPRDRQIAAMQSVQARLADDSVCVLRLLAPPFDRGARHPGYIKGYPPGVRENGAQYNHAAVWGVWAAAQLGWADQAREWFDWIHPVLRAATAEGAERYALEPYVLAGDISYAAGREGCGGWSWYTGSAPWLYRVLIERLLGLEQRGARLWVRPCLPRDWNSFSATLRYGTSRYRIDVDLSAAPGGERAAVVVDGRPQTEEWIALYDDGVEHAVTVRAPGLPLDRR